MDHPTLVVLPHHAADGATGRREPTVMPSVPPAAELIHLGMDSSVKEIVFGVLRPGEEIPAVDRWRPGLAGRGGPIVSQPFPGGSG
jgi:hypothetical protein